MLVTVVRGKLPKTSKNAACGLFAAAAAMSTPERWRSSATPPRTPNQMIVATLGATSTPRTYSRMVRPREILARKEPTYGDQEMPHAQKKTVQFCIQAPSTKAPVSKDIGRKLKM